MKKSLLLLVVQFLLAGCSIFGGGGSEEDDVNSEAGSKKLTIRFHVNDTSDEGKGYKKIIDAFNAEHAKEGIKVTPAFVARTGGNDAYDSQLSRDMMDGTLPDIITFDAPNCAAYANKGYLYDITNALTSEEKAKFITLNSYQGKLYGIPIQESSAGFYYNKKIFEIAGINVGGITVENPWTFDQFKDACSKLKANEGAIKSFYQLDSSRTFTPVDMRLDATKDETATYLLYPFVYAAGGGFVDETGLTATGIFDSANSIKGYQFLKDLVDKGYTSYGVGATDFFTGATGMYLSSGWTIPDLDNKFEAIFGKHDRNKWGILPYPKDSAAASATGSWSYAITNNARRDKTLVIELLKYITNATSSKTITDHTGMIAANVDADVHYENGSPEFVLHKQLELTGKERPATIGYPQFSSAFGQVISEIRSGDVATIVHNKALVLQGDLDKLK